MVTITLIISMIIKNVIESKSFQPSTTAADCYLLHIYVCYHVFNITLLNKYC